MSSLAETKQELSAKRRDYLTSIMMKLYFTREPVYDKNQYVAVLLDYMFMLPVLGRTIGKRVFLTADGLNEYNRRNITAVAENIQQGRTMANHKNFENLVDSMKELKGSAALM